MDKIVYVYDKAKPTARIRAVWFCFIARMLYRYVLFAYDIRNF